MKAKIMRGEMYYADLNPIVGSEQGGVHPVLILQNNIGNKHSPTVVVAPIATHREKHILPTHVELVSKRLAKNSVALLEQIRTIDKSRLYEYIGKVSKNEMYFVEKALLVSVDINRRSIYEN